MIGTVRRAALAPQWVYLLSIVAGLTIWEVVARDLPHIVLPPPSIVLVRLLRDVLSGALFIALAGSLQALVIGFGLALMAGIPLGFALGRNKTVSEMFDPVINAIYTIPPVAFVPFLIIWFGLHLAGRISLVFLMSVFEITITVAAGARDVNPGVVEVGRSFGARGVNLIRRVVFPATLPFVFTGIRLGLARAINAMITAELFFATANLGAMLSENGRRFDTAGVLSVIVFLSLFGLFAHETLKLLETRLLPWRIRQP